jgi:hypothetical protein
MFLSLAFKGGKQVTTKPDVQINGVKVAGEKGENAGSEKRRRWERMERTADKRKCKKRWSERKEDGKYWK